MVNDSSLHKCPNCEKFYDQDFQFCPHCGQKHEENVFTLKELLSDFLGSLFSFDSKAFKSLPKLIFQPGKLTVDYLKGKRASNLSPFRMYLFFSVVLFLLLPSIVHEDQIFGINNRVGNKSNFELIKSEVIEAQGDSSILDNEVKSMPAISFNAGDSTEFVAWKNAVQMIDSGYSYMETVDSVFTNQTKLIKFFIQQGLKINSKQGSGLVPVFFKSVSYSLFIFLPLFAFILKLFYVRRKRFYVEHFIFSLHIFSFIFFVLIIRVLLALVKLPVPPWIPLVVLFSYILFAIKKVYQQNWLKSILKYAGILFTTSVLLFPIVFVIIILISFIFY